MKYPKLPNVSSNRGAPMGRENTTVDNEDSIKMHLYRMPMVDGDYDNGGAYWGGGNSSIGWMYHAYGEGTEARNEVFVRAASREKAKEAVREVFPHARFYR